MGGGDLNLKKSWHPSTLRNIERVWKAEQKHEAEQQKIEQLQKELAAERAREEIQIYAEDQGVVRKKEEKLDWMYQGPAAMVNREEYLMGRKIDKTFETLQQIESGKPTEDDANDVGSSMFSSQNLSGTATVDLANKIREDPLFNIMKKEKEQKKNLLCNPVKMKQLQKMLQASLKGKSKKSKKSKKKKHQHDDSEDEVVEKKKKHDYGDSDDEAVQKKKKHEYGDSDDEVVQKRKKHQHYDSDKETVPKRKKHKKHRSSDSEPENLSRDSKNHFKSKHQDISDYRASKYDDEREKYRNNSASYNYRESSHRSHNSSHYKQTYHKDEDKRSKNHGEYSQQHRHKDSDLHQRDYDSHKSKDYYNNSKYSNQRESSDSVPKKRLDEKERERLLKEMQENAKWREDQRKKNAARYKEEEEREDKVKRMDSSDFMKPMLAKVAGKGTVESRVKQKVFTIQRSSAAMDKNFARRD